MLFNSYASVDDLYSEKYLATRKLLEDSQLIFNRQVESIRSAKYKWPVDAFHTWSRVWEYPYAYNALGALNAFDCEPLSIKIADIGSGVTFFPFELATRGLDVCCVDIDPICIQDLLRICEVIDLKTGNLVGQQCTRDRLPGADKSFDIIYSISVIEHVDDPQSLIREIHRLLKPNGMLILTLDIGLTQSASLAAGMFENLMAEIDQLFNPVFEGRNIHPLNYLTTENSPFPLNRKSFREAKRIGLDLINNIFRGGRSALIRPSLTVFGGCFRKRLLENTSP